MQCSDDNDYDDIHDAFWYCNYEKATGIICLMNVEQ